MKPLLLAASQVLLFLFGSKAIANNCIDDSMALGWEPIWEGITTVLSCGPEIEPMQFGKYSLRCNEEKYNPNYIGHAVLFEKVFEYPERYIFLWQLCLTENDLYDGDALIVEVLSKPRAIEKE